MDEKSEFNYFITLAVLMIMVSLHNLVKSILLYRDSNNNLKISNVIKISLNVSGLACGASWISVLLTMNTTSLSECLTVKSLQVFVNFAFSGSVIVFLVWKLKQFGKSKRDNFIVYILLLIRTLFYIVYIIVFIDPQAFDNQTTLCDNDVNSGRIFLLIATINDLLIDAYVAFRFIQYIRRNLKSTQDQQQYVPLSYALITWNSLRILMALIQHVMNTIILNPPIINHTIQTIIFILLSYIITFNVGNSELDSTSNNNNNSLESGNNINNNHNNHNEKNIKPLTIITNSSNNDNDNDNNNISDDDDIILRASNGMLVDMPLTNVHDEIKMEQNYKIEKLDPNGDIGFLRQSLSFYEIASMILGKDKKRQSIN